MRAKFVLQNTDDCLWEIGWGDLIPLPSIGDKFVAPERKIDGSETSFKSIDDNPDRYNSTVYQVVDLIQTTDSVFVFLKDNGKTLNSYMRKE